MATAASTNDVVVVARMRELSQRESPVPTGSHDCGTAVCSLFQRRDELFVSHLSQSLSEQLDAFRFSHAIQHAKQDASHHDTGDTNDTHRKSEWRQIGKDFVDTAVLAKFLTIVEHLDTAEV
jgi:hypothetical protein